MMRLTLLVLVFAANSWAQASRTNSLSPCGTSNLKEESANTVASIETFWQAFKSAVENEDRRALAKMVHYPLLVSMPNRKFYIRSEKDFIKRFTQIFPKNLRVLLLNQPPECINRIGTQGFSLGNGELWFDQYQDGKVRFFTVNLGHLVQ